MLLNSEIIYWNTINHNQKNIILSRPNIEKLNNLKKIVESIIFDVQKNRDLALYKYTESFDKLKLNQIRVSKDRIYDSEFRVSKKFKNSVNLAKSNIYNFHIKQNTKNIDIFTQIGIRCQQIIVPIDSVGLYVPGGTAPLVSTALMLLVPACIAGCKNIILCSPPVISNEILYIAKICNIDKIFEIGGAQSIAAMGFGTDSIPKVNKIFGPGNSYVTEAKLQMNNLLPSLSIDMIAGPSELLIISDDSSNPIFIASDVLAQCEHGIDSQVIVLSTNIKILKLVILEIKKQILHLSRRNIIIQSLKNSKFILVDNIIECINISNFYAPEHLMLQVHNPRSILNKIINAGSIFLGDWSPEAVGDYASGTNHVLPTSGNAHSVSGLSVIDFQKRISVQELTRNGLNDISSVVENLCISEKLDAHKNSIMLRVNYIKDKYEK